MDGSFHEGPLRLSTDAEELSSSDVTMERSEVAEMADDAQRTPPGVVEIRIPRTAWSKFGFDMRRSIAWSHNNIGHALYSMGRLDGTGGRCGTPTQVSSLGSARGSRVSHQQARIHESDPRPTRIMQELDGREVCGQPRYGVQGHWIYLSGA
jgi:hypothetical protein